MKINHSKIGAILGLHKSITQDDVMRSMVREHHDYAAEGKDNPAYAWSVANGDTAKAMLDLEPVELAGRFVYIRCPYRSKPRPVSEQPHIYANIQWGIHEGGLAEAVYYQWTPEGGVVEVVSKDDNWLRTAIPEIEKFWEDYLSELDNPIHLEPLRIDLTGNNRAVMLVAEYDDLREAKDNADERMKEIIAELSKHGRDAVIGNRKLTKVSKAGAVSYAKAVKALCPTADLEPFRGKTSEYWMLS